MNAIDRVARFMHENDLTLVTAESCTAGLISATLADIPGAGSLRHLVERCPPLGLQPLRPLI